MSISDMSKRIKQIRNHLKMNQKDYAAQIGVSQGQISDIERGRIQPSKEVVIQNIKLFDINSNWLLVGEGSMFIDQAAPKQTIVATEPPPPYSAKGQGDRPGETSEEELSRLRADNQKLQMVVDALNELRGPTTFQEALEVKMKTMLDMIDTLHEDVEELKKKKKPASGQAKPKSVHPEEDPQDAHMHAKMQKEPEKVTK